MLAFCGTVHGLFIGKIIRINESESMSRAGVVGKVKTMGSQVA